MQLFYTTTITDQLATLGEEESRHCIQVLRKRVGDVIIVVDGQGGFYETVIEEAHKKACVCRIQRIWREELTAQPALHIAIAPTKNINRLEWFLEKATEIGIHRITPILCRHAERKTIRADRLDKILLSAMKQSQRAALPVLEPLVTLEHFLAQQNEMPGQQFIAYIDENVKAHLKENYVPGQDVCILVGPEGGFSPDEVTMAKKHDFTPVSLGHHRLRTETAGLAACHTIHLMNWRI